VAYSEKFWRLSARGAAFAPSHHTIPGTQVGGTFQLATGGAFACAGYPGSLTFYGCLGGRFDNLVGRGTGTDANRSASVQIGSLAAGVTLGVGAHASLSPAHGARAGYPLGPAHFGSKTSPSLVHEVDRLRAKPRSS